MTALPQNPEVIVIGAGAAGLSAAKALQSAGVEVLVLEAAGHSGGRCVTDLSTFSTPFDRGGSWLHAAPINPLARIAENQGAVLHKAEWEWTRLHVDGARATPDEVAAYSAYQDGMWDVINHRGGQDPDISIADAMPDGRWRDPAIWWVPAMVGGDADVASAQDSHNYAEAEGDWLVEGGLGAFVARLHHDVPVVHHCPVLRIDTSGKGVRVSTPKGDVTAPHVILTVSTGVLAAQSITFVPPLPQVKQDAIEALPNGLLNKVGIEFDPAWQEAAPHDMADYHAGGEAFCSLAFGFYNTSLAVGFIAGRFAAELENAGAGAATMRDTYSTVHGAYLSGQRAADEVLAARGDKGVRRG